MSRAGDVLGRRALNRALGDTVASPPDGQRVRSIGWRRLDAVTQIMAQLSVRRGREAIEFYKAAFGAVEEYRVAGTDAHPDVVAQLAVGGASFWVSDESPPNGNFSPESVGGATARVLLVVDDPDAVVAQAVSAGAREVHGVGEEHGWRIGRVEDPFGHHWEIGRPLIDWPPPEQRGG
jgi:PhnB protein